MSRRVVVLLVAAAVILIAALPLALFLRAGAPSAPAHDVRLTANRAEWTFEDELHHHSARGDYYLVVNVTITNTGVGNTLVSVDSFFLSWTGSMGSSEGFGYRSVPPGASLTQNLKFHARGLWTPTQVRAWYTYAADHRDVATAAVPSPTGPPAEAEFSDVRTEWRGNDTYGMPPQPGYRFLWVTFNLSNHWGYDLPITPSYFTVCDPVMYGDMCVAIQELGQGPIASGATEKMSVVFELYTDWTPTAMYFDDAGGFTPGPWATVPLT